MIKFPFNLCQAVNIGLVSVLAFQAWTYTNLKNEFAQYKQEVQTVETARSKEALKQEQALVADEKNHAVSTNQNVQTFREAKQAVPARDIAAVERLWHGAEGRAASYRAQARANEAACGDLADQHAVFDSHIVRGVEVVGRLNHALAVRDAEVQVLARQVSIERALFENTNH